MIQASSTGSPTRPTGPAPTASRPGCWSTWATRSWPWLIALVIALPLGLYIGHTGQGASFVVGSANAVRALPTVGLLYLVVLGCRARCPPASPTSARRCWCWSCWVSRRSWQYVRRRRRRRPGGPRRGLRHGDDRRQVLCRVELPNALPLMFSGLRAPCCRSSRPRRSRRTSRSAVSATSSARGSRPSSTTRWPPVRSRRGARGAVRPGARRPPAAGRLAWDDRPLCPVRHFTQRTGEYPAMRSRRVWIPKSSPVWPLRPDRPHWPKRATSRIAN